jgi:mannose-1-phosphate guanylyltransferase
MIERQGVMDRRIIPLIMCGGAGTRLWPASREGRPKQFLPLFGARSTFLGHAQAGVGCDLVRASDRHHQCDLPLHGAGTARRNRHRGGRAAGADAADSGPAIAAGAAFAQARDSDAVVLARAADHVVGDTPAFVAACRQGLIAAESGRIVTFGVKPERAATEYGYISPGETVSGEVRSVAKFVEKPNQATAEDYIKAGYLWNCGSPCSAPPFCSTNTERSMSQAYRRSLTP